MKLKSSKFITLGVATLLLGACQKNEVQLQDDNSLSGAGTRMMVYFGNLMSGASRGDVLTDKTPGDKGENVMEVTYNKVEFTLIDKDGGRERTITLQNGEADKAKLPLGSTVADADALTGQINGKEGVVFEDVIDPKKLTVSINDGKAAPMVLTAERVTSGYAEPLYAETTDFSKISTDGSKITVVLSPEHRMARLEFSDISFKNYDCGSDYEAAEAEVISRKNESGSSEYTGLASHCDGDFYLTYTNLTLKGIFLNNLLLEEGREVPVHYDGWTEESGNNSVDPGKVKAAAPIYVNKSYEYKYETGENGTKGSSYNLKNNAQYTFSNAETYGADGLKISFNEPNLPGYIPYWDENKSEWASTQQDKGKAYTFNIFPNYKETDESYKKWDADVQARYSKDANNVSRWVPNLTFVFYDAAYAKNWDEASSNEDEDNHILPEGKEVGHQVFAVVTKYVNIADGKKIDKFEPGYIYRFTGMTIDTKKHIGTDVDGPQKVGLIAYVRVLKWSIVDGEAHFAE